MRADIVQAFALCAYAAQFIREETDRPLEMLGFHSTFGICHEAHFERVNDLHGGKVADSVAPWLRRLRKENVQAVKLVIQGVPTSDREPYAENWGVATDGDRGLEVWKPTWRKRVRGHSDPNPWRVQYDGARYNRWGVFAPRDTAATWADLQEKVALFIAVTQPSSYVEGPSYPDLLPPGHCPEHEVMARLAIEAGILVANCPVTQGPELRVRDALWASALRALECATEPVVVRAKVAA